MSDSDKLVCRIGVINEYFISDSIYYLQCVVGKADNPIHRILIFSKLRETQITSKVPYFEDKVVFYPLCVPNH